MSSILLLGISEPSLLSPNASRPASRSISSKYIKGFRILQCLSCLRINCMTLVVFWLLIGGHGGKRQFLKSGLLRKAVVTNCRKALIVYVSGKSRTDIGHRWRATRWASEVIKQWLPPGETHQKHLNILPTAMGSEYRDVPFLSKCARFLLDRTGPKVHSRKLPSLFLKPSLHSINARRNCKKTTVYFSNLPFQCGVS